MDEMFIKHVPCLRICCVQVCIFPNCWSLSRAKQLLAPAAFFSLRGLCQFFFFFFLSLKCFHNFDELPSKLKKPQFQQHASPRRLQTLKANKSFQEIDLRAQTLSLLLQGALCLYSSPPVVPLRQKSRRSGGVLQVSTRKKKKITSGVCWHSCLSHFLFKIYFSI